MHDCWPNATRGNFLTHQSRCARFLCWLPASGGGFPAHLRRQCAAHLNWGGTMSTTARCRGGIGCRARASSLQRPRSLIRIRKVGVTGMQAGCELHACFLSFSADLYPHHSFSESSEFFRSGLPHRIRAREGQAYHLA